MGHLKGFHGHGLSFEGAPYNAPGCAMDKCSGLDRVRLVSLFGGVGGSGHAVCACGCVSPHLTSGAARKAWHRDHKRQVAEEASV